MEPTRIARRLWQEIFCRRLPHGLLNWRYFLPTRDVRIKLHRQLWWESRPASRPLLLWLALEGWLWMYWTGYGAWRSAWIALRYYGPEICRSEGLSLWWQARKVLALALGWCIPASDVYRYALYRKPETVLDYVFDHETFSYHRWHSRSLGFGKESLELLQDKWRQTEILARLGVPMAPILAEVSRCDGANLSNWLQADVRLFCKTRSGNRGVGAFTAWCNQGEIGGRMLDGARLYDKGEVEAAWRGLLAIDDAIVQHCLENHPALGMLSDGEDAITVRLISQWHEGRVTCLSGTLEVPAGWDEKLERQSYVILPVDEAGHILRFPASKLLPSEQENFSRIHARLNGSRIPYWDALMAGSFLAHGQFPDVWTIAWDWVVTPGGPLLLEGNSGWGLQIVQRLAGGLLQH